MIRVRLVRHDRGPSTLSHIRLSRSSQRAASPARCPICESARKRTPFANARSRSGDAFAVQTTAARSSRPPTRLPRSQRPLRSGVRSSSRRPVCSTQSMDRRQSRRAARQTRSGDAAKKQSASSSSVVCWLCVGARPARRTRLRCVCFIIRTGYARGASVSQCDSRPGLRVSRDDGQRYSYAPDVEYMVVASSQDLDSVSQLDLTLLAQQSRTRSAI